MPQLPLLLRGLGCTGATNNATDELRRNAATNAAIDRLVHRLEQRGITPQSAPEPVRRVA